MKKLLCLTIVLFAGYWSAAAQTQTTKTIQLTYNASDFTLELENGLTCISSDIHDLMFDSDTLLPALPHINIYVLIDNHKNFADVSLTRQEILLSGDAVLAQNERVFPSDQTIPATITHKAMLSSLSYPQSYVEYTGLHLIDRSKVLSFKVYPFRYDANQHSLFLNETITLNIHLTNDSINRDKEIPLTNEPSKLVKKLVVNPTEIITDTVRKKENPKSAIYDFLDYEYLIVTNNEQKSAYQRLVDWKTKKGIPAKLVSVDEIDSMYSGVDLQTKIKYEIFGKYIVSDRKLKYVLLGGDKDIIPIQYCHAQCPNDTAEVPCDMYYGCLTPLNWDYYHPNGIYGEVADQIDLCPELIVSRLPSANLMDANFMVNNIIRYEQTGQIQQQPQINLYPSWNERILMGGKMAYHYYYPLDIQCSDVQIISDRTYNTYIAPYWSGSRFRFFDTVNDYTDGGTHQYNPTNLVSEINNGQIFINIHCHGTNNSWETESVSFIKSNISLIRNPQYSLVFSNSCSANAFNMDCLGVSFMKRLTENYETNMSNVIGFWGSTKNNFIQGSNIGPSDHYYGKTYQSLFTNTHHRLGEAVKEAKVSLLSECGANGYYRYLQMSLNLLGDPEMPVFIHQPLQNNQYSYYYLNDSLFVVPGVPNSTVCYMEYYDSSHNDIIKYEVTNNEDLCHFKQNNNNDCSLTITAPGYLPIILNNISPHQLFIQNHTISTDSEYEADEIYVGRDVTNVQSQGPVSIIGGTTTFKANDIVKIKNSFSVGNGAQLKILNSN